MSRKKKCAEKFTLADVVDFGGEDAVVLPSKGLGWAGPGWYLYGGEYPEHGSLFLGNASDLARLLQAALRQLAEHNADGELGSRVVGGLGE